MVTVHGRPSHQEGRGARTGTRPRFRWRHVAMLATVALAAAVPSAALAAAGGPATRTFESDAVGSVPAGCSTPSGHAAALVSDQRAYQGAHSLEVSDQSATALTAISCPAPAQQGAYLSFEVYPAALPNAFIVDISGDALVATGLTNDSVYHLAVYPDGSISWYDGGTWRSLAPAGTVALQQWSQVQLAVPSDNLSAVHVTVNGTYAGSGGPAIGNNSSHYNSISSITGYGFTSAGTTAVGDDVFVDNVTFGDAADTPASATGTPPLQVGPTSVIDDVGQVQLPASDVVVPGPGGGQRILAEYPAHSDASDTSGNRLAYSDDGGETWVNDQAANPMPDAPSFFMTRLRNGDILAVDYHTYMTPGSDTSAEVDTAVSHDNGATWTLRTGAMTTPQAMRSISTVTDRAGSPLGGFVLVHSVVEDPDGTLYQSGYGYYGVDNRYRQIVLVSNDEGLNWTVRATVATGDATNPTGPTDEIAEGALERVADGSLLIVIRDGSYNPLLYSRSTDNGYTWSTLQQLAAGPSGGPVYSVFPTLELLPSGQLVLLAGRPGLVMSVSADGLGDDWSTPVGIDYVNSENSAFAALNPSAVIMLGDRGRVSPWQVWSRTITLDQPCAQTVTGTRNGPLTVGSGGLCLDNATVNGPVTVSGGGQLIVQGSTIHGPVTTAGASLVSLCGSNVSGPVALSGTRGNVAVGNTIRGCDPDTIAGPLSITGGGGQVVADRSTVTGPLTVSGNSAALASVLDGLTVHGPLTCSGNAVTPTDSAVADTTDGPASGQCAGLG